MQPPVDTRLASAIQSSGIRLFYQHKIPRGTHGFDTVWSAWCLPIGKRIRSRYLDLLFITKQPSLTYLLCRRR